LSNFFEIRFNEILDRFVETFVAPRMAAVEGGEVAEVAYQRDAIMRVVMPEGPNTTNLHCDADYHHPPAEVIIIIIINMMILIIIS